MLTIFTKDRILLNNNQRGIIGSAFIKKLAEEGELKTKVQGLVKGIR